MAIFEGPDANRNIIIIVAVVVAVHILPLYNWSAARTLRHIHQVPQKPPSN